MPMIHSTEAVYRGLIGSGLTSCPHCGAPLTLIAAIEDPAVIAKNLAHLGLHTKASRRSQARTDDLFQTA